MKKRVLSILLVVSFLVPLCATQAKAGDAGDFVKQTTGIVLGVGVGPAIGGLRGLLKGWILGKDATAEALGNKDGTIHQLVGFSTGGVVGAAAGGVSGVLMGAYDGLKYGFDDPWSPENFSWGGSGLLDYDPFAW